MATTYAGIAFDVEGNGAFGPMPQRESHISSRHIPYSNKDDEQTGGLGNWRVALKVTNLTEAGLVALQNIAADGIARDLADFRDGTVSNAYLIAVRDPMRLKKGALFTATLEFRWEGV